MPTLQDLESQTIPELKKQGQLLIRQYAYQEKGKKPKVDPEGWLSDAKAKDVNKRRSGTELLWEHADSLEDRAYDLKEVVSVLCAALTDRDDEVREHAVLALGDLRQDPQIVIPVLVHLLFDSKLRKAALEALECFNPESLPVYLKLLKVKPVAIRAAAAWALGYFDSRSVILPRLMEATEDSAPTVRWKAAHSLVKLAGKKALKTVIPMFKDKSQEVREHAISSLQILKDKAQEAIPAVIDRFTDVSPKVREQAEWTLYYIGGASLQPLRECLQGGNPLLRLHAARSLQHFRKPNVAVINAVLRLLNDKHADVREAAVRVFERYAACHVLAKKVSRTASALVAMLEDPNESVRRRTVLALGELGTEAKEAVPSLLRLTESAEGNTRYAAAMALQKLKLKPEDALLLFRRLLDDDDPRVCCQAIESVRQQQLSDSALVCQIVKLLESAEGRIVREAAKYLAGIGPKAKNAIPILLKLLKRRDVYERNEAALALWAIAGASEEVLPALRNVMAAGKLNLTGMVDLASEMGPLARPAVPTLVEWFPHEARNEKGRIAEALAAIGPAAAEAVDTLVFALSDRDCPLGAVNNALAAIGAPAVPALVAALQKPDPQLREFAADALARIGGEA